MAATGNGSIFRLNADGSPDLTFDIGEAGFKRDGATAGISGLIVRPDGRILVAGDFTSVNGNPRPGLARLNGDAGLANSRARLRSLVGVGTGNAELSLDVSRAAHTPFRVQPI